MTTYLAICGKLTILLMALVEGEIFTLKCLNLMDPTLVGLHRAGPRMRSDLVISHIGLTSCLHKMHKRIKIKMID